MDPYPGIGADQQSGAGRRHAAARHRSARPVRVRAHDRVRAHHDAESGGAAFGGTPGNARRASRRCAFSPGANSIFYGEKLLTTGNPEAEKDAGAVRAAGPARDGACKRCVSEVATRLRSWCLRRSTEGLRRRRRILDSAQARYRRRPRVRRFLQQRLSRSGRASAVIAAARRGAALRRGRGRFAPDTRAHAGASRAGSSARALRRICPPRCSSRPATWRISA